MCCTTWQMRFRRTILRWCAAAWHGLQTFQQRNWQIFFVTCRMLMRLYWTIASGRLLRSLKHCDAGETPKPVTHYSLQRFHHLKLGLLEVLISASIIGLFYWLQPATWTTVAVFGVSLSVVVVLSLLTDAMLNTAANLFTMATTGSQISGVDLNEQKGSNPSIKYGTAKLSKFA